MGLRGCLCTLCDSSRISSLRPIKTLIVESSMWFLYFLDYGFFPQGIPQLGADQCR